MPSAWISKSDAAEVRIAGSHSHTYDLVNDLRFQGVDKTKIAAALKAIVHADLETVIRIRDLPDDEPCKLVDPAPEFGERFFWRGRGRDKQLVARDTIVEDVTWDRERYIFTLREAR